MPSNTEDDWPRFIALFNKACGEHDLKEFFELFLTVEERDALAKRFLIIEGLLKGERNQRDLARDIGVSISKITRGSNCLKTTSKELKTFLRAQMR